MRILLFSALLAMTACEKKEEEKEDTRLGSEEDRTRGMYRLASGQTEKPGVADFSGNANRRLRADGTYVLDLKNFTLAAHGVYLFKDCTLWESGNMSEDGKPTDVTSIVVGGECGQEAGDIIVSKPSMISAFARTNDDEITVNLPVTYDDNGTEQSNTIILMFMKTDPDVWAGEGTDPVILGDWNFMKVLRSTSSTCSGDSAMATVAHEGRQRLTFAEGTYERSSVGFGTGGTKCTGSDSGSMEWKDFTVTLTQTNTTADCAKDLVETDVVTRRDQIGAEGFDYMSYVEQTSDDPDCPGSEMRTHTIRFYEKII